MLSRIRKARLFGPLIKLLHRLVPDRYTAVTILGGPLRGRRMMLNLRYQMGYWLGLTEQDVTAAIQTVITTGDTVYDVGAEIGYFSLIAAVISRTGSVYAFEPNPANVAVIRQTNLLNSDLSLHIIEKAVGNRSGRVKFVTFENRADISNASLLGRLDAITNQDEVGGDLIDVDMIDLDSFSVETGTRPGLVKIDVEGAEGMVLQGMTHLLVEAQPCLIIEIHNETAQRDVMACLTALDYDTLPIGRTFERAYPFRVLALPAKRPLPEGNQ